MLVPGDSWRDVIQGCFPGHRMTGCPRQRAMEIIDKLEPQRRGPHGGSLGWIGFHGDMTLNVLDRTIFLEQERLSFPLGARIVADSDAAREYQASLDTAQTVFHALRTCQPAGRRKNR